MYSSIALDDSVDSVEALKRGVFLQWFHCAEPAFLTGIADLDARAAHALMEQLEFTLSKDPSDLELKQMVRYYLAVADWCLAQCQMGAVTKALVGEAPPLAFLTSDGQRATYSARGLMGSYFLSLHPSG